MKKNEKEKLIEYKIILIGDINSNKTKIFKKMMYNNISFIEPNTTIEVDFETKNITYKNKKYSITLQDTASQERFRGITKSYFHMGDGFFIVFNLSNRQSLESIEEWINSIKEDIQNPKIVILGHETQSNNNIPDNIINQYLNCYPEYKFLKVSAEKNKNINEALYSMIDTIEELDEEKVEEKINFRNKFNYKLNKYLDF